MTHTQTQIGEASVKNFSRTRTPGTDSCGAGLRTQDENTPVIFSLEIKSAETDGEYFLSGLTIDKARARAEKFQMSHNFPPGTLTQAASELNHSPGIAANTS